MIRTILATLVTAGIFAASTAVQAAPGINSPLANGADWNGNAMNGGQWNGNTFNGVGYNGGLINGSGWNGKAINGGLWNGKAVNGAEMRPGTVTIVDIKLPDGTTFQAK